MTREEAIEILIAVAVCDRPILSCDFCARYVGMGTDCTYPSDKEIEESVLLLKGASNDAAISALRQQEHFRDLTKKTEPLTMDELRQMDGEPVWCEIYIKGQSPFYGIVNGKNVTGFIPGDDKPANLAITNVCAYGLAWLAYRQKPEEVAHD